MREFIYYSDLHTNRSICFSYPIVDKSLVILIVPSVCDAFTEKLYSLDLKLQHHLMCASGKNSDADLQANYSTYEFRLTQMYLSLNFQCLDLEKCSFSFLEIE